MSNSFTAFVLLFSSSIKLSFKSNSFFIFSLLSFNSLFSFSKFAIILFASIACSLILFSKLFIVLFPSFICLFNDSIFNNNFFFSVSNKEILSFKFCFSFVNNLIILSLLFCEFLNSVIVFDIFFNSSFNLIFPSSFGISCFSWTSIVVFFFSLIIGRLAETLVPFLIWKILQSRSRSLNFDNMDSKALVFFSVVSL